MNPLTQSHQVNCCPNCGCDIIAVQTALAYSASQRNGGAPVGLKHVKQVSESRPSRLPWNDEERAKLKELRALKVPVKEIADRLGRPLSSVNTQIYARKEPVQHSRTVAVIRPALNAAPELVGHGVEYSDSEMTIAMDLKNAGKKAHEIAGAIGRTTQQVYGIWKKAKDKGITGSKSLKH